MSTLEDVLLEWQNNLAFKQAFKKNPTQALANAGLVLSPEDLLKITSILPKDDRNNSENDELDKRINK